MAMIDTLKILYFGGIMGTWIGWVHHWTIHNGHSREGRLFYIENPTVSFIVQGLIWPITALVLTLYLLIYLNEEVKSQREEDRNNKEEE